MKIVPDTSVIIDGRVTQKLEKEEYKNPEIIISEAVISELEAQANQGQETGISGLEEIQNLKKLDQKNKLKLTFKGERPSIEQIKLAPGGEIDHLIRNLAIEEKALLLTSDIVQAEVGKAKGLKVQYLKPETIREEAPKQIWDYFKKDVMSVHLREGTKPKAKIGTPGNIQIKQIGKQKTSRNEIREIAQKIVESGERSNEGFIEYDKGGGTVVQLKDLRIVIARPPFSDGYEITAIRPVAEVSLEDYRLSEELKERITAKRRGVLLAGAPGAGKSTLAQALAEHLMKKGFVIKTMEEPRDLQVPPEITQYRSLDNQIANTADLLLLVRPDYTIFDEIRKTPHFQVFADMRLAGVGMIGVTHANRAIDALQRLLGRVELGMTPQVVDTIIFLEEGKINKVYELKFTVKVPAGMTEEDLARPVIQVKDFETKETEYEIYTYGEQTVIMPVEETPDTIKPTWKLAEKQIEYEIDKYVRGKVKAKIESSNRATVYIPRREKPRLIGKEGENIDRIEQKLGLHIDVRTLDEKETKSIISQRHLPKGPLKIRPKADKIVIQIGTKTAGQNVDLYADGKFITSATVGQDGNIKMRKNTETGQQIIKELEKGNQIKIA